MLIFFTVIGLVLLIVGHEAGHFFAAKWLGLKVDEFGFGFPPRLWAWRRGETEYSLNWLPLGGFVKIAGEHDHLATKENSAKKLSAAECQRYFSFQPIWRKVAITVAGVGMNFFIGWLLLTAVFVVGTPAAVVIGGVQPDSPGSAAGLQEGDILKNFSSSEEFIRFADAHRGQEVTLEIERGSSPRAVRVTPRVASQAGQGAIGVFLAEAGTRPQSIFVAPFMALRETAAITWLVLSGFYGLLAQLVTHGLLLTGIVGPVGIFALSAQAGELGIMYVVQLLSLISINLAVANLIPFPALDGGRLLLVLIEKIKGAPLPRNLEMSINGVGFALLLFLMAIITVRDVAKLL